MSTKIEIFEPEKLGVEPSTPVTFNIEDPEKEFIEVKAGPVGPAPSPRVVNATLTTENPVVPDLGTFNVWTVNSTNLSIVLPERPAGFQTTVKIIDFSRIVWPGGTVISGDNTATTTWATLIRQPTHWEVLVPTSAAALPDNVKDTGWVHLYNAVVVSGAVTVAAGNTNFFDIPVESTRFGPYVTLKNTVEVAYRRLGNVVYLKICNVQRNSTPTPVENKSGDTLCILPHGLNIIPPFPHTFVCQKGVDSGSDFTESIAFVTVSPAGTVRVRWCSEGEVIGLSWGAAPAAGPVVLSWVVDSPWPT